MKKNYFFLSIFLSSFILPTPIFSWNENGHVLISQLAYENLSPSVQKQVNELSKELFKQLPFSTQYRLNDKYPDVSTFAKLSTLPDHFRKQPLRVVFEQYQGTLPSSLKGIAEENTYHWHFTNQIYPAHRCSQKNSDHDAVWAVNTLKPFVQKEKDPISKGLSLILLTHFIEDLHQPLHTFSYVNQHCKSDKGGNAFCLSQTENNRHCRHNLHSLWDTGVGFLKGRQANMLRKIALVSEELPSTNTKLKDEDLDPAQWAQYSYRYAQFIYSTKPYQKPDRFYYKKGQQIAKQQMALAAYHLTYTINQLLSSE